MRHLIQILSLVLISICQVHAQTELGGMSAGAGYNKQSFVKLAEGAETQVNNTEWDIAFTVDAEDAGVFVNESSGTSMGNPTAEVELFIAASNDFEAVTSTDGMSERIYNDEKSWHYGAFNEGVSEDDPTNYGWGVLNTTTGEITGDKVFIVKLRDGSFRKLEIESMISGVYSFRIANLDGSNDAVYTIDKADYAGYNLAYFSIGTHTEKEIEPEDGYDLLFCRYLAEIWDPGALEYVQYNVTGVLSGPEVLVAEAQNVIPEEADFADYEDSLSADLDIIGHDWKSFNTTWSVDPMRVYFIKTADEHLWKLNFLVFEGSLTGNAVYEITDLGGPSASEIPDSPYTSFSVYPNPAVSDAYLVFTAEKAAANGKICLYDNTGKLRLSYKTTIREGLNSLHIDLGELPNGLYMLSVGDEHEQVTKGLALQR